MGPAASAEENVSKSRHTFATEEMSKIAYITVTHPPGARSHPKTGPVISPNVFETMPMSASWTTSTATQTCDSFQVLSFLGTPHT